MTSNIESLQRDVDVSMQTMAAEIKQKADELIAAFISAVRHEEETTKSELEECRESVYKEIDELNTEAKTFMEKSEKCLRFGERLLKHDSASQTKSHISTFTKMVSLTEGYEAKSRSPIPQTTIALAEATKTEGEEFVANIGRILKPDLKSFHVTPAVLDIFEFQEDTTSINRKSEMSKQEEQPVPTASCDDFRTNRKLDRLKCDETINTKLQSETDLPHLTSILVLENEKFNKIVITDYKNRCLKVFCSENTKISPTVYTFQTEPFDSARLKDKDVLVSLPNEKQLVHLKIQSDIHMENIIPTFKACYYIAFLPDGNLVVSEGLNGGFFILKPGNDITQYISQSIPDPGNVTAIGNNIVVISQRDQTMTCVTSSGDVIWTSRDSAKLKDLKGVACDEDGIVYVCDCKRNAIVQVSRHGEILRDVITHESGLTQPRAVCCHRDKLYVAEKNGNIKIYTWCPVTLETG